MSTNATPTENGIDADEQTCPNGNAFCPHANPSADNGDLVCFACHTELSRERPQTDAWTVAL